ncbi:MAG: phage terminase large subunit [Pyrinomonadaceae bacterium]
MTSASEKPKIDKYILNAAKIAACRELFIKYNGRSHHKIEAEMRELGFHDFSRRILYARKHGTGKRPGWIAEFGWTDRTTSGSLACEPTGSASLKGTDVCERAARGPVAHRQALALAEYENFQTWLQRISPEMTWDWRHQLAIYEYLNRLTIGDSKRLMIFMPPRHGKSELVTVRYAAWRLRRDPKMKIILASYGQELANTFSRKIKSVICDDLASLPNAASESEPPAVAGGLHCDVCGSNKNATRAKRKSAGCTCGPNEAGLQPPASAGGTDSLFPFSRQRPINTAAQWGTTLGGGVRAVGVGCGVTGFGGDLVIIDDPIKSRAQAESETYRERVWNWFTDDLYTRLEPEARMILIQTRWHEDDLAGRLIKQMNEGGEHWDILDLPAIAEVGMVIAGDLSEPGAIATGSQSASEKPAEICDRTQPQTVGKAGLPPRVTIADDESAGVNPPSGLSIVEPSVESSDEPVKAKPRPIGFPRLYSHVVDWAESGSIPVTGSSADAMTEAASLLACDAGSSGGTRAINAKRQNAGGTGVCERAARGPIVGPVDWRLPGDPLCPERFDLEELEKIREQLGMYGFSALYQQKPTPPDGAIFKREWLRNIIETPPPGLRWFRGYDLAISTKTTADYTASFRVALNEMGFLYIADGYRERIEYPEQRRFIMERIRTERGTRHGIEDSSNCKSIIQDLRRDRGLLQFSFKPVPVINDKLTRALSWSHLAEAGKLKLVRGAWIKPFVNELIRFPQGKHDDQVDAVSVAVQLMAEPTDKKLHRF